ncbi:hyaluronidase-like isoform X2 [Prorops nasuta]
MRFQEVSSKFGIRQNTNDSFRGDQIAILYDPGSFPALLQDKSGKLVVRNGGVPQEGNLTRHLEVFAEHLISQIPDESFQGLGVIDFESWRPIFRQNWASLQPYKDLSMRLVSKRYPTWDKKAVEHQAAKEFEKSGRIFMEETLKLAVSLRPAAKWTYYAYPYCFNETPNHRSSSCEPKAVAENDRMKWLFSLENFLAPSIYMRWELTPRQRLGLFEGRIKEAERISRSTSTAPKIIPYIWYMYQDKQSTFVLQSDMETSMKKIADLGADGFIVWGSSMDVNTKEKCEKLYNYLLKVLGPAASKIKREASQSSYAYTSNGDYIDATLNEETHDAIANSTLVFSEESGGLSTDTASFYSLRLNRV